MTHQEAKSGFESFKATTWTNEKGEKLTAGQIASKYTLLGDRERQLRKAGEAQKKVEEQAAEIARLKALLEGKKATGKAA